MEDHALASGLEPNDALIATTALENSLTISTASFKPCRPIKNLSLKTFRP